MRTLESLVRNGVETLVIIPSFGSCIFTVFHCTIHFTVFPHTDSSIFSSAVFGVNTLAIFCPHLNAHAIQRFHHAQSSTDSGVTFHWLAISNFAHASPHSIAIFAGVASFHNLRITQTLFGQTKALPISVTVSHNFALVVFGSNTQSFCMSSLLFCPDSANTFALWLCSSISCQNVLSENPAFTHVARRFVGVYCPAFDKKEVVSPITFGTSEATHPRKSAHTPRAFCINHSLFASLHSTPFCASTFCASSFLFCSTNAIA